MDYTLCFSIVLTVKIAVSFIIHLELGDFESSRLYIQGADDKLGQFLSQDIWATANHRNCLQHSLESCLSVSPAAWVLSPARAPRGLHRALFMNSVSHGKIWIKNAASL